MPSNAVTLPSAVVNLSANPLTLAVASANAAFPIWTFLIKISNAALTLVCPPTPSLAYLSLATSSTPTLASHAATLSAVIPSNTVLLSCVCVVPALAINCWTLVSKLFISVVSWVCTFAATAAVFSAEPSNTTSWFPTVNLNELATLAALAACAPLAKYNSEFLPFKNVRTFCKFSLVTKTFLVSSAILLSIPFVFISISY